MSLANRTIDLASQQILKAAAGTAAAPAITRDSDTDTGLFFPTTDTLGFSEGGTEALRINSSGNLILGNGDTNASPSDQILRATNASGSNVAGASLTIQGGQGTGTGAGGIIAFNTSAAGSSGSSLNSATERLRIGASGQIGIGGSNFGTSGQVLTSNGTGSAPSWSDGITLGTSVASTSGTSIDFTGIPSWVKRITVMFNGVSTSGTSSLLIQVGSGSITSSGYNSSSAGCINAATPAVAVSTSGYIIISDTASDVRSGHFVITNMGSNLYVSSHIFGGDSTRDVVWWGGGSVSLSGDLDQLRITTSNGTDTFDAGSINIMYEG